MNNVIYRGKMMAFEVGREFDLKRIQKELNIKQKNIDNCPIPKSELGKIYQNYQSTIPSLEKLKATILSILNEELAGTVHSIRCRIKDADHLIEKIIRNVNNKPDKYKEIDESNYNKIITDLIGVRIIILDKRDWRDVHDSLLKIFRNIPERYVHAPKDIIENYDRYLEEATAKRKGLENSYHAEEPVVYVTSHEDRDIYVDDHLKIDYSKSHYRSIHYIIRNETIYFEIQVRTLFEEGWLEFDHRIKYPYDQNNKKKQEYASVLSSLAIAADRLISFYEKSDFEQGTPENTENTEWDTVEDANTDGLELKEKLKLLF